MHVGGNSTTAGGVAGRVADAGEAREDPPEHGAVARRNSVAFPPRAHDAIALAPTAHLRCTRPRRCHRGHCPLPTTARQEDSI